MKTFANKLPGQSRLTTYRVTARQRHGGNVSCLSLIRAGYERKEVEDNIRREYPSFDIVEVKEEAV